MNQDTLLKATQSLEWLERLEDPEHDLQFELLADGRLRAQNTTTYELLRDRLRSAEILPTGLNWSVIRSRSNHPHSMPGRRGREVIAAGILDTHGWNSIELLNFIANAHESGVLTVHTTHTFSLYIRSGDVAWATSSRSIDRLGPFLLRRGHITKDQLQAAIRDGPGHIGRACVERGFLSEEELAPLLSAFVSERFSAFVQIEQGLWSFSRIDEENLQQAPVSVSAQQLLVEGLRQLDEMRVYRQRIYSASTVVKRNPKWSTDLLGEARVILSGASPELPQQAETILRALPGTSSIGELMRRTYQGEFEVTRTVYHLLRADLITLVSPLDTPTVSHPQDADVREVIHIYQLAFVEIMDEVSKAQLNSTLIDAIAQFIESEESPCRDLLSDFRLTPEGYFNAPALHASLGTQNFALNALIDALGELLFYTLLKTSECIERRKFDDLARRVRLIHGMLNRPEDYNSDNLD